MTPGGSSALGQRREQRTAHLPQHPGPGETQVDGERAGRRVVTVGPQPQRSRAGRGRGATAAVTSARPRPCRRCAGPRPVRRRPLDLVGRVDVRVPEECPVAVPDEQVHGRLRHRRGGCAARRARRADRRRRCRRRARPGRARPRRRGPVAGRAGSRWSRDHVTCSLLSGVDRQLPAVQLRLVDAGRQGGEREPLLQLGQDRLERRRPCPAARRRRRASARSRRRRVVLTVVAMISAPGRVQSRGSTVQCSEDHAELPGRCRPPPGSSRRPAGGSTRSARPARPPGSPRWCGSGRPGSPPGRVPSATSWFQEWLHRVWPRRRSPVPARGGARPAGRPGRTSP